MVLVIMKWMRFFCFCGSISSVHAFGTYIRLGVAILACSCADGRQTQADGGLSDGSEMSDVDAGVELAIEPSSATLVVRDAVVRQSFIVRALYPDGTSQDVTRQAGLSLKSERIGVLSGATFTSTLLGGETELQAEFRGAVSAARIEVRVEREDVASDGPMIPNNPSDIVSGAPMDSERQAPEIVYPNPDTLLPPNLPGIELHFRPGDSTNSLFRVRFRGEQLDVQVFTGCRPLGAGCLLELSGATWRAIADTIAGRGHVSITIDGTDASGTARSVSTEARISVTARSVEGGLYYWSTSQRAIFRVDFGVIGEPEQFWPPAGTSGGHCYGCHALSPNGQRMTVSINGQNDGRLELLDVRSQSPLVRATSSIREQFQSWNPDSTQFVAMYGDSVAPRNSLRIRDGETAEILATIDLGFEATHVDWSPAGDRIAFTRVTQHGTSQRPGRGGIAYIERRGDGWSPAIDLVPPADGLNHYTPAYDPTGQFVVFARSECPSGRTFADSCDADADPSSRLWAILKDGGSPIELTRANAPGATDINRLLSNTFPKWAPFVDTRSSDGMGRVMWMTFSSRRRYGLRAQVNNNQLLWMFAVDPEAILRGQDGSYPAFALPFQDFQTSNHIAQWTQRVVPTVPDAGVPDSGMCKARGESCDLTIVDIEECCGGLLCTEGAAGMPVCTRAF